MLGGVRAVVLASRYLIEPAGKGRSRLVHLARVDTKFVNFNHIIIIETTYHKY